MAIGVGIALVLIRNARLTFPPREVGLFVLGSLLAVYGTILIHELGHLTGGWLGGMRFWLFIAGPLRIYQDGEQIRAGLNRSFSPFGGLAAMSPSSPDHLRGTLLMLVAGGPIASLLSVGPVAYAYAHAADGSVMKAILQIGLLAAVLSTVATAIPSSFGSFHSDGSRLLMLLRGGAAAERWIAYNLLGLQLRNGVRPRELDRALLATATRNFDGSFDAIGSGILAHYAAVDAGDVAAAEEWLDRVLEHKENWPPAYQQLLFMDLAFFEAEFRNRPAKARTLFDANCGGQLVSQRVRSSIEAAVLRSEGRYREAVAKAEEALRTPHDNDGGAVMTTEWLERLLHAERRSA
jgi:hypothetical protein